MRCVLYSEEIHWDCQQNLDQNDCPVFLSWLYHGSIKMSMTVSCGKSLLQNVVSWPLCIHQQLMVTSLTHKADSPPDPNSLPDLSPVQYSARRKDRGQTSRKYLDRVKFVVVLLQEQKMTFPLLPKKCQSSHLLLSQLMLMTRTSSLYTLAVSSWKEKIN